MIARRRPGTGRHALPLLLALCLPLAPAGVEAGQGAADSVSATVGEPFPDTKVGKMVQAYRIVGTPPDVDGQLDDEVWEVAPMLDDMVQIEPVNMDPPTYRTTVQVAFDDRYVYVAAYMYDDEPALITTGVGRRDDIPSSDRVWIGFDPRHDHLTAYAFETNPSGMQADYSFWDDTRRTMDYDAVWEVRTAITGQGWTAEFRIPFSQMRFDSRLESTAVWGFLVVRDIYRTGERDRWVGIPRGGSGLVSRYGHLVFEDGAPAPPRRMEVLPYVLGGRTTGVDIPGTTTASTGADVRFGVGSAATLSATVNPDFAQVEQDPAVLNLTVFETFFPERRPFFLEDARTFIPSQERFRLFHSRRIGRTPGRIPVEADVDVVERPSETTLLGAAKLTGKISGWTFGGLSAVTSREYATVTPAAVGIPSQERQDLIEPLALYSVGRVQRDVGRSSNVGALVTLVNREHVGDAVTAGFDHGVRWGGNRWRWDGFYAVTRAPGRDDGVRSDVGVDMDFAFEGKYVGFGTSAAHIGRDFRVNDVGFLRGRVNVNDVRMSANLGQPDPWGIFRSIRWSGAVSRSWNTDGLPVSGSIDNNFFMQFANYWRVNGGFDYELPSEDDLDTRGGPPIRRPGGYRANAGLFSDSRKTWSTGFFVNTAWGKDGSWQAGIRPSLNLQPSPRLQVSLSGSYTQAGETAQWIINTDVTGDGAVDHVYGRLHRDVIDVTLRTTVAVHRDLTFQAYLQPFVAVGDYDDIRYLARPRSFDFTPALLSHNPDFNVKSLRGNVVLRWEYVRGSTLFVVWNMSASDAARPGVFSPWRDLGGALGADGTQALLVKVNYWWSR
ncbi:MAG: hypothetical protein FJW23_10775 [Acidimicrobiia bacterium]|nr:hypothetical protein [Acidimicrobiia bacterium]